MILDISLLIDCCYWSNQNLNLAPGRTANGTAHCSTYVITAMLILVQVWGKSLKPMHCIVWAYYFHFGLTWLFPTSLSIIWAQTQPYLTISIFHNRWCWSVSLQPPSNLEYYLKRLKVVANDSTASFHLKCVHEFAVHGRRNSFLLLF